MAFPVETVDVKTAEDYIAVLSASLPVIAVGGAVAVMTHLQQIVAQQTWARRLYVCLSVLSVGCVAGGLAVLGLGLFLPEPSVKFDIVAAAIAGSAGQKTFDIYSRRIFGRALHETTPRNDA